MSDCRPPLSAPEYEAWRDRIYPDGVDWRDAHARLLNAAEQSLGIFPGVPAAGAAVPNLLPAGASILKTAIECGRMLQREPEESP